MPLSLVKAILDPAVKLLGDLSSGGESSPALRRGQAAALNLVADILRDLNDIPGALAAAEQSLAIARELSKDDGDPQAQRDLRVSFEEIGDVKFQAGDQAGALAAYEEDLAIARGLAKEKGDLRAQRDLSISLEKTGNVKLRAGDQAGASAACKESLGIRRELAKNKSNAQAQRDLSASLDRVGGLELLAGRRTGALAAYAEMLAVDQARAVRFPGDAEVKKDLLSDARSLGGLAYRDLLAKDFAAALDASNTAISVAPDLVWLRSNQAHALMFLGRADEARAVYLGHRGNAVVSEGKTWDAGVLADFAEFRKAGLTDPLMDEITAAFAAPKAP